VKATTKALISQENDPPNVVGSENEVEGGVNRTKFKNPLIKDPNVRPKDKVDRLKTILQQVKEKAIKNNKSKARKTKA